MTRAFILSHGARIQDWVTFVPAGKSLAFYSEVDTDTFRWIGLAALNAGDIEPTEVIQGPAAVYNYLLEPFEDSAMAQHLASESSRTNGKCYFVGQDLPSFALSAEPNGPTGTYLCTSPDVCQGTYPHHHGGCQGALNVIGENEILSVSCRGIAGQHSGATRTMEGSTEFMDEVSAETQRILAWSATDPAAAIAYWESLSQSTQAMIGAHPQIAAFVEGYYAGGGHSEPALVRQARGYLESYGEDSFFEWLMGLEPEQQAMIRSDVAMAEVEYRLLPPRAREYLDAYGEEYFFQWLMALSPEQQLIIRSDDALAEVEYRISRQRLGLDREGEGESGEHALMAARIDEQVRAINAVVAQLAGDESDASTVADLATAVNTVMEDISAYQVAVGDGPAYSLYEAGAHAAQALAEYSELPDTDSAAKLRESVGRLAEWSASIAGQ